jgi:hypothetical protein
LLLFFAPHPSIDLKSIGGVHLEFFGVLILVDGVPLAVSLRDGYGMLSVSAQDKAGISI